MTDMSERMLPLYEAKMIHQFDHRWATYDHGTVRDLSDSEKKADVRAVPRYWVSSGVVHDVLRDRWSSEWLFGWRDIARATDARTTIAAVVGSGESPEGGTLLILPQVRAEYCSTLIAGLNSFAFDFCARQKVGGTHLKYFTMRQLPVPTPRVFARPSSWAQEVSLREWISTRVLELTYTAWDMQPFAEDLDDHGAPFVWDTERRFLLRAELDAAFFHVYGVARDDADYILDTFPIVKRKDEEAFGEYRTKRVILEIFDAVQLAIDSGTDYDTLLDPPAGHGTRHPDRQR